MCGPCWIPAALRRLGQSACTPSPRIARPGSSTRHPAAVPGLRLPFHECPAASNRVDKPSLTQQFHRPAGGITGDPVALLHPCLAGDRVVGLYLASMDLLSEQIGELNVHRHR